MPRYYASSSSIATSTEELVEVGTKLLSSDKVYVENTGKDETVRLLGDQVDFLQTDLGG